MCNLFRKIYVLTVCLIFITNTAFAGPPFETDDPVPVDFRHWEFYVASSYEFINRNEDATLPHFEVNYGPVPNVQLHILAGMGYVKVDANH